MNNPLNLFNRAPLTAPLALNIDEFKAVIVLVPHPDDEAIGCGGLIHRLFKHKVPMRIILVTDGSGAGDLDKNASEKRLQEFRDSVDLLNPDAQLEYWNVPDGQASYDRLLHQKVEQSVSEFAASHIVAPWALDMHPDHSAIGKALLKANAYSINAVASLFYEVWSPVPANRILDISEEYPVKKSALECHKTALACGGYVRAMHGLSSYRSLLTQSMCADETYAEAYFLDPVKPEGQITTTEAGSEHKTKIESLFQTIYQTTPSENWWQWKYGNNLIKGSITLTESGEVVAFYGNICRTAVFENQRFWASQIADVMIHPSYRHATKEKGAFFNASLHFLDKFVGDHKAFKLSFGFPHHRALKLGVILKLYQHGDRLLEWKSSTVQNSRWPNRLAFRGSVKSRQALLELSWVDAVFNQMSDALSNCLLLTRSAEYWYHRFFSHPDKHYECLRLDHFGSPVAGAVFQIKDQSIEIIDMIFTDKKYIHDLIKALKRHAAKLKKLQLTCWGTESYILALGEGDTHHTGWLALPDDSIGASLAKKTLNRCWMTSGDSDFK